MTNEEALGVLAILQAAYPDQYKRVTPETALATASVWATQFYNIPLKVVMIAAHKWIGSNQFVPKPCDIKKKIASLYWEIQPILNNRHIKLTAEQEKEYREILEVARRVKENPQTELSFSEVLEAMKTQKNQPTFKTETKKQSLLKGGG